MKLSVMLFPFHSQLINGTLDAKSLIATLKDNGAEAVNCGLTLLLVGFCV